MSLNFLSQLSLQVQENNRLAGILLFYLFAGQEQD